MNEVKCATKAFIIDNGKILVFKCRREGREYFDIPGGKIEFGLTPEENLRKEVMEEVGIEIDIKKMIGISQFVSFVGDQIVCINYLCEPKSMNLDLGRNPDGEERESIIEALWIAPEELYMKLPDLNRHGLKDFVKNHLDLFSLKNTTTNAAEDINII